MIETITPDVCGSRRRQRIAFAAFTVGAVSAAALLGTVLGLAGAALGREALVAAVVLAALGALRELGLVRLPLPQLRLQVPERWRAELPLVVWASGYGAGLGIGFATFQPVATFWVACAGALALGSPVTAAVCLSFYGLGRAVMVVGPALREPDAALAAENLLRRRPAVGRLNAVALAGCALALALAPVAGAGPPQPIDLGSGNHLDPSVSRGVLAYTEREFDDQAVVVRVSGSERHRFPNGRTPSLDGNLLAYADHNGVRVVRWRSGAQVARVSGLASRPALDWPWLAVRLDVFDGSKELWLRNLTSGQEILVARVGPRAELGRPSLVAGRLAWAVSTARGSNIGLYSLRTGARRLLAKSKISLLSNPSLSDSRVVWVQQRGAHTYVRLRPLNARGATTLASSASRNQAFWTTALSGRTAYLTRWIISLDAAQIERARF
jgi:hypothetical protein